MELIVVAASEFEYPRLSIMLGAQPDSAEFDKQWKGPIFLSSVFLLFLLTMQFLIFAFSPWPTKYQADENYYVTKALSLITHGETPKAKGPGDLRPWRPAGYPQFIALCCLGDSHYKSIKYRCASMQFLLISLVLVCFHIFACFALGPSHQLYVIAFLTGIQPWTFSYSRLLYPDSLTASLLTLGLLGLFAFIRAGKSKTILVYFSLSILLLATTITLRAEMIVLIPVFVLISVSIKYLKRIALVRISIACGLIFVAVAGLYAGYRLFSTGSVQMFGRFSIHKRGALNWVGTWFATERSGFKRFLYGPLNRSKFEMLPEHAFLDDFERSEIRRACELSGQRRVYDREVDKIFQNVADKRKREHFFINSVLTRTWAFLHLWVNPDVNEQLLRLVPRESIFFIILVLGFAILKFVVYVLATLSFFQILRHSREGTLSWYHTLTILMIVCVFARTLLMGGFLGWIHRYALPAWPAMLWCAISACIDISSRNFHPDDSDRPVTFSCSA